jgi:tRNA(Ile)-lysidine synthase
MHPLEREITRNILHSRLINDDEQTIVVAVSGGPDSVALLHLLLPLRTEMGVSLVAAYINHGLRPAEAEQEEFFVRCMCGGLGVSFHTASVNVRAHAHRKKISLEHAARELRYQALRKISTNRKASLIAVAHTADDQAEEILIRLLRGSGRKGVSGMQSRSRDIIRPLLSVGKDALLRYLEEKNISYCLDSSNTDMRFTRNRVRHKLIPFLEETFDRGIRASLCKTADSLAEDEQLLEELTAEALREVLVDSDSAEGQPGPGLILDREKFARLPGALKRRTVEQLLWRLHCPASYSHIMRIVDAAATGKTGSEIHLSRGLRVGVQRKWLEFLYPQGQTSWRGRLYSKR